MGFAIAGELANQGAMVFLVCGPVETKLNHPGIKRINVTSAVEMYNQCQSVFAKCNGAVMAAAVADYAPVRTEEKKIKRESGNYSIELKPNPDIAAALGQAKRSDQILVGFALETDNEEQNAIGKLRKKNLDFIVLNSLRDQGAGFQVDTNKIRIITKEETITEYDLKPKSEVARDIVEKIIEIEEQISGI